MSVMKLPGGTSDGSVDIFLHVKAKRAGKIKGEATTAGHEDDIEVYGWTWGAQAGSALGSTQATARRSYHQLVVTKSVDAASTGLMSALATNDEIREAVLAMRKAGGQALDFFKLTLGGARVVDVSLEVDGNGRPVERVSFAFTKVDMEYQRQQSTGSSGGAMTFSDVVLPA